MSRTIYARPLLPSTVPTPLLHIISPALTNARTRVGNGGTSIRTADIVPCVNDYHLAPSGTPGRAILSASRNVSRPTYACSVGGQDVRCVDVGVLERHPFTTQSFSPLGGRAEADKTYVVVVAQGGQDRDAPDLETVQAFTVKGNEGVCYGANVWHAPMAVLREVRTGHCSALLVRRTDQALALPCPRGADDRLLDLSVRQRRARGGLRDGRPGRIAPHRAVTREACRCSRARPTRDASPRRAREGRQVRSGA